MATTKFTYVSLENLQQYDSLLKPFIEGKISDAVKGSLKTVAIEGNTLKFYTVAEPVGSTAPAYTIELPEADLSDLIHKIKNATVGDVVIANADGTISDGGVKLTDLAKSSDVTAEIGTAKGDLEKKIKTNTDAIAKLNGADTTEGSVAKAVKDAKDALQANIDANKRDVDGKIGNLDDLTTTAKGDLVSAITEVKKDVDSATGGAKVTVDTTTTTEGAAKSYTIKQGGKKVATIDIPKDMVVKSGAVETNPTGQPAGTYLVLTLANATEDKIYINVGKLVDIYTAQKNAAQIQLAIDSATREISATIVAGSVGTTELADGAITTVKIADSNITKVKLAKDVQASLGKADTALQAGDIADLEKDVAASKASLATGGKTYNKIQANTEAIATAQASINELKGKVSDLESVEYVAATEEQIKALFPNAQA